MIKFRFPSGGRSSLDFNGLTFRFLLAVDVEGFSQRPTAEQARAQRDLKSAIRQAAAAAQLDVNRWYHQPGGDGELSVLPEGTDGLSLVADYPRFLASALAVVNEAIAEGPRLRVRVAIHHGALVPGLFGPVGAAPVEVSRLVDAEVVRQQLRRPGSADVALIVSATIFNEIVQSKFRNLRPEEFRRVAVKAKGIPYVGYLRRDAAAEHVEAVPATPRLRSADSLMAQTPSAAG